MMIKGSALILFIGGIMLWLFSKMIPLLQFMLMDMVAIFMMCGSMFILLFCLGISGVGLQFDTIPPGTAIINYIRRDGFIVPQLGKRIFSGESFLDVPKLGLIEDLGKDTVFTWGRKRVRFGLENINYTPDPRHFNMTHALYQLGFDDSDDLYNILNLKNIDPVRERAKKAYYLERMGNIYWNMTHERPRSVGKLMELLGKRREKNTHFGKPRKHKTPVVNTMQFKTEIPKPVPVEDKYKEMDEWLKSRK